MNAFTTAIFCLALSCASAGHLGYGGVPAYGGHYGYAPNPAAHIPSGSVSISPDGAAVAGPAGSIKTDNGVHSHSAGALVQGPAGQIATRGGHTTITGPGKGYDDTHYIPDTPVYAAAPVGYAVAPAGLAGYAGIGHAAPGVGAWGPAAGLIGGHGGYGGYGGYGYGGHGYAGHW